MLTEERDLVASELGGGDLEDELLYLDQLIAQLTTKHGFGGP